jgi:hypothetical protein
MASLSGDGSSGSVTIGLPVAAAINGAIDLTITF